MSACSIKRGKSLGSVEEAENIAVNTAYLTCSIKNNIEIHSHFDAMAASFDTSTSRRLHRDLKKGFDALYDFQLFQLGTSEFLVGTYEIL